MSAAQAAAFVTNWVLPVVGALFALYLLVLAALVVVTAALKLTSPRGAHRRVLDVTALGPPPAAVPPQHVPLPSTAVE
ncbi:hypothetical protein [Kineococcus indalonis]|uniref:hypothetical protein n=1 Tax=Kineococcus indalonis TaxID=2696566 RepID=UPI00141215A3|nr:hypothetical protein [Kineococcus indalonis]NAZ88095.1 hypothetical protein [Kineococcus indalonis]